MKKVVIFAFALLTSAIVFAQEETVHPQEVTRDFTTLKGLSWGLGIPFECRDLPGAGITVYIGYDCAYPINDKLAMGFYLTGGGGLWSEYKRYSDEDNEHVVFRLTAGLMMAFGDIKNKPFLIGVAPGTGIGFYDLDLVLPVEVRFGKYITNRWYIMGELTYHVSLADETATIEPAIRVGYNFGRKQKK